MLHDTVTTGSFFETRSALPLREVAAKQISEHDAEGNASLEEGHPQGAEGRDGKLVHPDREVDQDAGLRDANGELHS